MDENLTTGFLESLSSVCINTHTWIHLDREIEIESTCLNSSILLCRTEGWWPSHRMALPTESVCYDEYVQRERCLIFEPGGDQPRTECGAFSLQPPRDSTTRGRK